MALGYDSVQFVCFLKANPPVDALTLWERIFDQRPLAFHPGQPVGSVARGHVDSSDWLVQVQPNRIDIVATPPEASSLSTALPSLKDAEGAITRGNVLMHKTADIVANYLMRPAVVFQASEEVDSPEAALARLNAENPLIPIPDNAIEVNYQVIVRSESNAVEGLNVHSMTRWATGKSFSMRVDPGRGPVPHLSAFFFHRVADVFTDPDRSIPIASFHHVTDEITARAKAIAEGGVDALAG